MLITPWPSTVCMKSSMFSIGSPKNLSPPCSSICIRPRWIAPTLAALTLPYSVVNSLALSPTMLQHRAQVLQVEQQQAVVVGDLEDQVQHAGLGVVERQHARQQQRAHVGDGGAHRVALLAEHVPQRGRAGHAVGRGQAALGEDRGDLFGQRAGLADAGQVALDVGHEHRHADAAEVLGQRLQRDRLAGAGGAGDQAVAVGQRRAAARIRCRRAWATRIGSAMGRTPVRIVKSAATDMRSRAPHEHDKRSFRHGRTFQVGQHPAPQGPPGRKARQGLDARDPRNHGRGAPGRR